MCSRNLNPEYFCKKSSGSNFYPHPLFLSKVIFVIFGVIFVIFNSKLGVCRIDMVQEELA